MINKKNLIELNYLICDDNFVDVFDDSWKMANEKDDDDRSKSCSVIGLWTPKEENKSFNYKIEYNSEV